MNGRAIVVYALLLPALLQAPAVDADVARDRTIKSLEAKEVEIRTGNVIVNGTELARDSYRAFLDLVSDDPELRAEAMRRLGDLELDATEAEQLAGNIDTLDHASYRLGLYLLQRPPSQTLSS